MADYTPVSVGENDVRSFLTPPLDYDDVSKAEILLKIESVETYVKYTYFGGGTVPVKARIPILLLTISNLISTPTLARKYYTLASEQLGDYNYVLAQPTSKGSDVNFSPFTITKTWHNMGLEILQKIASPTDYIVRKANE